MRIHCRLLTSTYPFADQNMYYYISNSLLLATFLKLSRDREGAVTLAPVWLRLRWLAGQLDKPMPPSFVGRTSWSAADVLVGVLNCFAQSKPDGNVRPSPH